MFWLALIGLGISIVGGIFSAIGQAQKNQADLTKLQGNVPVYNAEQVALDAQLANIKNEQKAATDLAAINEAQIAKNAALNIQTAEINKSQIAETAALNVRQGEAQRQGVVVQGLETAQAGAQAVGSVGARAGAGNLGGASVLRQAQAIQTQTSRRVGVANAQIGTINQQIETTRSMAASDIQKQNIAIGGITTSAASDIQKQELQLSGTLGNLGVQSLQTSASLLQSQMNEANTQADIQFLKDYGWMSVAAVAFNAGAQAINTATNINWPAATTPDSLATEDFNTQYDYRQWGF